MKGKIVKAKNDPAIKSRLTESQIIKMISEDTDITAKDVKTVLNSIRTLVRRSLKKRGIGVFKIPVLGIMLKRKSVPARKKRKGINPFTGEACIFKAKPASTTIKASALKKMKSILE